MRLADVNLLLYAVDESSPHHESARRWLEESLSGAETLALSWSVLLAFLRLGTNPRVFASPLGLDEALDVVDSWLAQPNTTGPSHRSARRAAPRAARPARNRRKPHDRRPPRSARHRARGRAVLRRRRPRPLSTAPPDQSAERLGDRNAGGPRESRLGRVERVEGA